MDCLADCERVLALEPENSLTYINRAEARFALAQYQQALTDYEKAQSLNPDTRLTTAGIAITKFKLGDVAEARQLWTKLVEAESQFKDMEWVEKELHWAKPLVEAARELVNKL
ncbi:MAG: tetratricopeptide repeat protein [Chloroflexota bacterium]